MESAEILHETFVTEIVVVAGGKSGTRAALKNLAAWLARPTVSR